jgi:hypothetical protein
MEEVKRQRKEKEKRENKESQASFKKEWAKLISGRESGNYFHYWKKGTT